MPLCFFLFCSLRGHFRCFGDFLPFVGDFIFAGCRLSVVIGELSPILVQSIAWFEGETKRMSEVRSIKLETGLSSSGGLEEGDTAVSTPRTVRAFYALKEMCGLSVDTVSRFKDRFLYRPKKPRPHWAQGPNMIASSQGPSLIPHLGRFKQSDLK